MLAKAQLVEIKWDAKQQQAEKVDGGKTVTAQFNPQTLKLTFANENKGGDQPGGSSKQFVGSGSSKMSVELLFDTTAEGTDVRKKTEEIAYFIQAKPQQDDPKKKRVPPGLSFEWGSFIFRGIVDSMEETIDYFSEEGVPLRATISFAMSRQEIEFLFGKPGQASGAGGGAPGGAPVAGTQPLQAARPGDSMQSMTGRLGISADWKAVASANNIDDPLRLEAGALINVNASVKVEAGVSLSASLAAGSGAVGANVSSGTNAGARAGGSGISGSLGVNRR